MWDIRENKVLAVIKGHEDMVTDVGFLPCPDHKSSPIVVSVGDATCRIWDALQVEAKQLQCLKQHDNDYEVPLFYTCKWFVIKQVLGGMGEERKEEGLYACLRFYRSAPFWHFCNLCQIFGT